MAPNTEKFDRWSLWFIGIVGLFVFIGGILQVRSNLFFTENAIFRNLQSNINTNADPNAGLVAQQNEAAKITALQQKDSDSDGISDFQEQYVYTTSAYLADSDSDGTTDKEEIQNNTNPNCPEGGTCEQARTTSDTTEAEQAFMDLGGNIDPDELRQKLKEYGVPEDVLAKTDDETLLKLAAETASQTGAGSSASSGTSVNTGSVSTNDVAAQIDEQAEAIRNMTLEEKKSLLLEAGIAQEDLSKLDEAAINEIFDQVIEQAKAEVLQEAQNAAVQN